MSGIGRAALLPPVAMLAKSARACVQSSMRDWQDQEMSTAIWAMASMGRSREGLLEACAAEAMRRGFQTFAPQAVSNFVWGFATLGYCNNAFLTVRCLQPYNPEP